MDHRISLIKGDITLLKVDAIVNAANNRLAGGGGVDGAIHRAGGPDIMAECNTIRQKQGGCETGDAVITTGGNLPAKSVIHTVGPVWYGGKSGEEKLLAGCYRTSLEIAAANDLDSIAFPGISTGVYGYPVEKAAVIAIETVDNFLKTDNTLKKVIFVCYDEKSYLVYKKLLSL